MQHQTKTKQQLMEEIAALQQELASRSEPDELAQRQTQPVEPGNSQRREWLAGGGEMGKLIRAFDWLKTPVGPIESWPKSLRTTVSLLLASRYPITVIWGPELIQFYNDGYMKLLGTKHPNALGRPHRETFPEVLETVGPMIESVMTTGTPIWEPEQLLVLEREGYLEECYFTLSYSPVQDDTGGIAGMLCICSETTQKVLGERLTNSCKIC